MVTIEPCRVPGYGLSSHLFVHCKTISNSDILDLR